MKHLLTILMLSGFALPAFSQKKLSFTHWADSASGKVTSVGCAVTIDSVMVSFKCSNGYYEDFLYSNPHSKNGVDYYGSLQADIEVHNFASSKGPAELILRRFVERIPHFTVYFY